MRLSESHQKQPMLFANGADSDTHPHLYEYKKGFYKDATNMLSRDDNSNGGVLEKNKGDSVKYPDNSNIVGDHPYVCIGSIHCGSDFVEFFALDGYSSYIRINGDVMVYSANLPLTQSFPLQLDKNESCLGGEVFGTDFNVEPFILNIGDIKDNFDSSSEKYFSDFDWSEYKITLNTSLDHPIFVDLTSAGNDGLKVGMYSYSYRYADSTGNKTSWSVATPYIPVPYRNEISSSAYYVTRGTLGANYDNTSAYGIKIRLRINNESNYEYIEVKRVKQFTNQPINTLGVTEKILVTTDDATGNLLDIQSTPYTVIDFIDDATKTDWEIVSDTEATEEQGAITKAKAIRYYANRLVLANYEVASRDVANDVEFIPLNGEYSFPVVEKLGMKGHSDIYNQVYRKNCQTGEKYRLAIQFYDNLGLRTLAVPIEYTIGVNDIQIPNRRKALSINSSLWSVDSASSGKWKGAVLASDIDTNSKSTPRHTHEVFDLSNASNKSDMPSGINIRANADFLPLTPVGQDSSNDEGLGYRVTTDVFANGTPVSYFHPQGKNYYVNAVAIAGLKKIPSGYSSFQIVRSKRAERVIAQGIGVYSINPTSDREKPLNKIDVYFPDLYTSGVIGLEASDVVSATAGDRYKLEIVSPLGFRSECFNGAKSDELFSGLEKYMGIDLLVNADLIRSKMSNGGYFNSESATDGLKDESGNQDYYTAFGAWRNASTTTRKEYNILSAQEQVANDSKYIRFTLNQNIYQTQYALDTEPTATSVQKWHEPFYIINLVAIDEPSVSDDNFNEYQETGHFFKLESLIGLSSGVANSYHLVSERWEDCCVNRFSFDYKNENRYVYIQGIDGSKRRWLDVTYRDLGSPTTIQILDGLTADGYYDLTDVVLNDDGTFSNETIRIYGIYKHTNTEDRFFTIDFNHFNVAYDVKFFIPQANDKIYVKYDRRMPLRCFIGDTYVSENIFALRDIDTGKNFDLSDDQLFKIPFPYYQYRLSDNYPRLKRDALNGFTVIDNSDIYLEYVRQIVVQSVIETRYNIPLSYGLGDSTTIKQFPQINYVMRPLEFWDDYDKNFGENDRVSTSYDTAEYYLGEYNIWGYGGFKYKQFDFNNACFNLDYQKFTNDNSNIDKPKIGFKENTKFCTGVIWSEERSINEQDDPNLKTFVSTNTYSLDDSTGEIKFLYDNNSTRSSYQVDSNNLFAITESGICNLVVDRNILSDVNGNQLAYIKPSEGFIQSEIWITKSIGSDMEMWRGRAEYDNMLYFPNKKSVYMMSGMQVVDLAKELESKYSTILYPVLGAVQSGYATKICATYDESNNEYWLNIGSKTYVFKSLGKLSKWVGKLTNSYEQMSYDKDSKLIFGTNNRIAYETEGVYTFASQVNIPVVANVELISSAYGYLVKEFIDLTISSSNSPTTITCYKDANNYSIINESQIRDFTNSYYAMIPRMEQGNRYRLQNQHTIINVENDDAEAFTVSSAEIGYKIIR